MPVFENMMDPLVMMDTEYEKCNNDESALDRSREIIMSYFTEKTKYETINTINESPLSMMPDGSLVRFRGMIQDQMEQKCYIDTYKITREDNSFYFKSGAYRDKVTCEDGETITACGNPKDHLVIYAVPIPGENKWAKDKFMNKHNTTSSTKRTNDDLINSGKEVNDDKKSPLNNPLACEKGTPCILKFYDTDREAYNVNDIVEVFGIVNYYDASSGDFVDKVPHIHVLLHDSIKMSYPPSLYVQDSRKCMKNLVKVFTLALLGDSITAQYLVYNLLSSVYSRIDIQALGKFSLNIYGIKECPDFVKRLYMLISRLVCKSHLLPLTIDNLNSIPFCPRKCYELNRVCSGLLQLSNSTTLVVDETVLANGKLETQGMDNLTALGNLIQYQNVDYDFHYHKMKFTSDVNVIILGEGKSIIKCDSAIKLKSTEEITPENLNRAYTEIEEFLGSGDNVEELQGFLAINKQRDYVIDDISKQAIEQEFVNARQISRDQMSVEDFHNLLTLMRLMSKSAGVGDFQEEFWTGAKSLEAERKSRLTPTPVGENNPQNES